MNPHDWYLSTLFRLDRLQAIVNAIKSLYSSKTHDQSQSILRKLHRLTKCG